MARRTKTKPTRYIPVPGTSIELASHAAESISQLAKPFSQAKAERSAYLITRLKQKLATEYGMFGGAA